MALATSTYSVRGMTCQHCVNAVTEELLRLGPVAAVRVDLDAGTVEVDSSIELARDEVAAAVAEAGYVLID